MSIYMEHIRENELSIINNTLVNSPYPGYLIEISPRAQAQEQSQQPNAIYTCEVSDCIRFRISVFVFAQDISIISAFQNVCFVYCISWHNHSLLLQFDRHSRW